MDKMTYEERVRQIAEEMARTEDVRLVGYDRWHELPYKAYFKTMINYHYHNARIAVAKMAESFTKSYCIFTRTEENLCDWDHEIIRSALIEYGIIPNQPAEKDAENNNWKL